MKVTTDVPRRISTAISTRTRLVDQVHTALRTNHYVSSSTQNQALQGILYLSGSCRILKKEVGVGVKEIVMKLKRMIDKKKIINIYRIEICQFGISNS